MSITQQHDGYYLVEMYPFGRGGRRIRKRFSTKAEALRFEAYIGKKAKDEDNMCCRAIRTAGPPVKKSGRLSNTGRTRRE